MRAMIRRDQNSVIQVIDRPVFREVVTWLRNCKHRDDDDNYSWHMGLLSRLKREAVGQDDQLTAKALWCLETICEVQRQFLAAYQLMRAAHFQEAWQLLERCEIANGSLAHHFTDEGEEFGINHVATHVKRFQDLYPLHLGNESRISIQGRAVLDL